MQYINIHIVLQQVNKESYEYRLTGKSILAQDVEKVINTLEQLISNRNEDETTAVLLEGSFSSLEKYNSITCWISITELYKNISLNTKCICDIQSEDVSENWHDEFKNAFSRIKTTREAVSYAKKLLTSWLDCLINDRLKQMSIKRVAEGSCTNFFEF